MPRHRVDALNCESDKKRAESECSLLPCPSTGAVTRKRAQTWEVWSFQSQTIQVWWNLPTSNDVIKIIPGI